MKKLRNGAQVTLLTSLALTCSASASPEPWVLSRLDLDVSLERDAKRVEVLATLQLTCDVDESDTISLGINSREAAVRFESVLVAGDRPSEQQARAARPVVDGVEGESDDRESGGAAPATATVRVAPLGDGGPTEVATLGLARPAARGDRVEVRAKVVIERGSSQIVLDPSFMLASWVEHWYPVPRASDGFASPAAPGSTRLIVPADWRGVAPGALSGSTRDGDRRIETWETTDAAARSFAAGPLARVDVEGGDGPTVAFFVLEDSVDTSKRARTLQRAIVAMERHFGPYPYPSWNVVEVPETLVEWAAASEQGFILVRSSVLANESGSLPLLAHEAAHGWWGNLVRGNRMTSEALAQFGAVMAIETLEGRDAATEFLRFSRPGYNPLQCALGFFYYWRQGDAVPLVALDDAKVGHNLADSKGMWFYWMLRERIGDDALFGALAEFKSASSGKETDLAQLRPFLLAAAPDDEGLDPFLTQWLERGDAPVVDLDWWSVQRGQALEVVLTQRQRSGPYVLDLDLAIQLKDGGEQFEQVHLEAASQSFTLSTASRPMSVRLDPHHRVLLWRPEYGPRP